MQNDPVWLEGYDVGYEDGQANAFEEIRQLLDDAVEVMTPDAVEKAFDRIANLVGFEG